MQGKPKKGVIGIKCISAKLYQPDQAARTQTATYYVTYSLEEFRLFDFQV